MSEESKMSGGHARPAAAVGRPLPEAHVRRLLTNPTLLAQLSDVVLVLDVQLCVLYVSRLTAERRMEDVVGSCVLDHCAPNMREAFKRTCEICLATGEPQTMTGQSAGDGIWWESRFVRFVDEHDLPFLFVTSAEVTARKRAEDALAERESQLRASLKASGVGIWHWDRERDVVSWDDNVCRIYGVTEHAATDARTWFISSVHPDDRERLRQHVACCLETGAYDDIEHRVVRPDGEVRTVFTRGAVTFDAQGAPVGLRGGIIDVTARRTLEEQLRQVQKMEAVGQLTAGVAHNFNNLISIALPNLELCRARSPAELHPLLDDTLLAAERAVELVRQLMRIARQETNAELVSTDLGVIARHTGSVCRATFDRRIHVEVTEVPGLPPVRARAGEIEQVLLNLCLNARDALESGDIEAPRIELKVGGGEDGCVTVTVTDNGPGIDPAIQGRIFEPFFTTKEVGKGTGLGLASAYAIVADHRGQLRCESSLGAGCTFVVELPVADEAVTSPSRVEPIAPTRRGSERILLIDDEPLVRRALRGVLEQSGFAVREAVDGNEGLQVLEQEPVDLVVLDRSMPQMSGEQFMARRGPRARRVPVLLLTGCPAEAEVDGVAAVMVKPARTAELVATLRRLLDERA